MNLNLIYFCYRINYANLFKFDSLLINSDIKNANKLVIKNILRAIW